MLMKKLIMALAVAYSVMAANAKTLVVYYSFTNNVHTIVSDLQTQIDVDAIRIEPAEEGLDYLCNSEQSRRCIVLPRNQAGGCKP